MALVKRQERSGSIISELRSNHFGTAGNYVRMAADQGLIGLAVSNTGACVAPWGGSTPTWNS